MAALDPTYGMVFIGLILATCLYGVNLLQMYNYYRRFPNDHLILKITVGLAMLLDTIGIGCAAQGVYWYLVTHYGDTSVLPIIDKGLDVENLCMVLVTFIVQCFFGHSVWSVSGKNVIVTGFIYILTLITLVLGLVMGAEDFILIYYVALGVSKQWVQVGLGLGLAALCDISITVSLCYYFRFYKGGFKETDTLLDKLMIYTVNRGIATATIQTLSMAFFIGMPQNLVWAPFHMVLSKVYIITLLATLNRRDPHNDNIVQVNTTQLESGVVGISIYTEQSMQDDSFAMRKVNGGFSRNAAGGNTFGSVTVDKA